MLRNRDIIMIASARWQMAGKVNCHHIAERLAEHNRVLFVESPGLRAPKPNSLRTGGDLQKMVARGGDWLRGMANGPRSVGDTLHVLSPLAYPMHGHRIAKPVNRHLFGGAVRRAAERLGYHDPLLWIFLPTGACVLDAFPDAPVIYHCIDHYAGIEGTDAVSLDVMQQRLLDRSQLVFATSRPLARELAALHPRVVCVPNVSDVNHFLQPRPLPEELASLAQPILGYVGHLSASMVDLNLLDNLAAARPQWSIVLIGSVGDDQTQAAIDQLSMRSNVHFLGSRNYLDVPAYVHGFDVCLVPFLRNSLTDGALPLKTFEYLAAAKPVVSTPLAAMIEEPLHDVVHYADDAAGFINAIETALSSDDASLESRRVAVAHEYSWDTRFPQIVSEAATLFTAEHHASAATA